VAIRRIRPTFIIVLAWLLVSVMMTALLAPQLGGRGLLWLGLQDVICLFGCGWELARLRRLTVADLSDAEGVEGI